MESNGYMQHRPCDKPVAPLAGHVPGLEHKLDFSIRLKFMEEMGEEEWEQRTIP